AASQFIPSWSRSSFVPLSLSRSAERRVLRVPSVLDRRRNSIRPFSTGPRENRKILGAPGAPGRPPSPTRPIQPVAVLVWLTYYGLGVWRCPRATPKNLRRGTGMEVAARVEVAELVTPALDERADRSRRHPEAGKRETPRCAAAEAIAVSPAS